MKQTTHPKDNKILLDKNYVKDLEKKASFLEEILEIIEEKILGYLMETAEKEKNIPLTEVKKLLK